MNDTLKAFIDDTDVIVHNLVAALQSVQPDLYVGTQIGFQLPIELQNKWDLRSEALVFMMRVDTKVLRIIPYYAGREIEPTVSQYIGGRESDTYEFAWEAVHQDTPTPVVFNDKPPAYLKERINAVD